MIILQLQNMVYAPATGGANRSSQLMLSELAAAGHECHALAPAGGLLEGSGENAVLSYLGSEGIPWRLDENRLAFHMCGVDVLAVPRQQLGPLAVSLVRRLKPDFILIPSDDPAGMLLAAAASSDPVRIVYIIHTIQHLPFGPRAFYPSPGATRIVKSAGGVVAVSQAAAAYAREYGGLDPFVSPPAVYSQPRPSYDAGERTCVTIVNASAYKGIDIFLAIADAEPAIDFLAIKSWGTTENDVERLRQRSNIRVLDPCVDMEPIWERTRLLLMPSLWDEAFGYTAIEAMLRGIPVIASDWAGLREAKLGVPFLVPVVPIDRYVAEPILALPRPIVDPQPVDNWLEAVRRVLEDGALYRQVAEAGRAAATSFVAGLDPRALETYLRELQEYGLRRPSTAVDPAAGRRGARYSALP